MKSGPLSITSDELVSLAWAARARAARLRESRQATCDLFSQAPATDLPMRARQPGNSADLSLGAVLYR
jgi:hypothetical protein